MSDITLSKGVRANLLSLQSTAALMSTTQERLSTGKKVNSALDNPVNFFTASGLQARAGDLNRLLDSVSNAVQTVQAADKGISSINKLIESAQATARQALTAAGPATEAEFTSGASTVDYTDGGDLIMGAGDVATFTIGGQVLNVDDTTTVQDILDHINSVDDLAATIVAGDLQITSEADIVIAVGGADAAAFTAATGIGAGTTAATSTDNASRTSLQSNYNQLLTQITQLARDASFNGVNLLDGDNLTVQFNEDGSSSLTINGVDFSATGLGLTAQVATEFQTNAGVNAAIAELDAATTTLRSQAAAFGSNLSIVQARQDFTKNMINVLQIGADNLVLADTNEEGANMLALQTRQQLSTVALSLAAQADQNVLQLF